MVRGDEDGGAGFILKPTDGFLDRRQVDAEFAQVLFIAHVDGLTTGLSDSALAGDGAESGHVGRHDALGFRVGRDRDGDGVLGGVLDRGRKGQHAFLRVSRSRRDFRHGGFAVCERTSLVQCDRAHGSHCLNCLAFADQDAPGGRDTRADH